MDNTLIFARRAAVALAYAALAGCMTTTLQSQTYKSYSVGVSRTATIGDAFIVDQNGTVSTIKRWVGVLNSLDGWQINNVYSQDWVKKELIYGGKSGSTIEVTYREFRGGYAAPAFYQNLKYDLNSSATIRFQKFTIQVQQADNQTIVYTVLSDR
ncbi:hypothetical protein [Paraburkholderia domus]|uniref:hypothetical protein n=1 Tax=Paraburkholderia domus TaxID=2793075 RepID=UPI001B117946|nr:hypothetical protein [Paraburkholderia domus]CAE6843421.1 hypothetical protein R75483_07256 [Paraburkholderia domus]CAE6955585.1 hypothetical protein R75471_06208 [Paraburkholderia domus]